MSSFTITVRTELGASVQDVWGRASTMEGVNEELAPWVRMTVPRHLRGKRLADVETGREAFTSTLLLFSVLPFDRHHLKLERILESGFDEESWTWLNRRWRHERRIEALEAGGDGGSRATVGCIVTDRVTVEPRLGPAFLLEPIVQRIFESRHRKLLSRFGPASR